MKNNIRIKGWKASEIIMLLYVTAVLAGLPLVVTDAYYYINVDKYYFYCGACVLLIPVLILRALEKPSVKNFFKSLSLAEKALLAYWVISALSTVLSQFRYESFWGNEGRFSGLFLMTIYVIAYFVISRCYRPHPICIYACMAAGCAVFAFGVTDFLSMDIFHFKEEILHNQIHMFMSTIGNINFYASYAGLVGAAAATIYATWTKKSGTAAWFLLMTFSFVGIVVSNSDSVYLGLGALLGFLPLYLFKDRRGIRRYFMVVSSFLLALSFYRLCALRYADIIMEPSGFNGAVVSIGAFSKLSIAVWILTAIVYAVDYKLQRQNEEIGKKAKVIWGIFLLLAMAGVAGILIDANLLGHGSRYGSLRGMVEFNDHWGTNRGFAWRKAIENYREFPLIRKIFGYGPETFGIISYFHNMPESKEFSGELFDNAHNEYLQFLITIGPAATAAYISFLALSVRDMVKCHCSPYVLGMAFAVTGYGVQAFVNINQPASTPIMWTFLAMGIAECRRHMLKKDDETSIEEEEIWTGEQEQSSGSDEMPAREQGRLSEGEKMAAQGQGRSSEGEEMAAQGQGQSSEGDEMAIKDRETSMEKTEVKGQESSEEGGEIPAEKLEIPTVSEEIQLEEE